MNNPRAFLSLVIIALLAGCSTPPERSGTTDSSEGGDYNREMHLQEQADMLK